MSRCLILLLLLASLSFTIQPAASEQVRLDDVLTLIDDMATGNMGALCAVEQFRLLGIPLPGTHIHHDATRQKVDLAADMLREAGIKTQPGLLDAVVRSILVSDRHVLAARVLVLNATSGDILALSAWRSSPLGGPPQLDRDLRSQQPNLDKLPWLINRPWSQPYYACSVRRWIISYTVDVSPSRNKGVSGILSTDMDLSDLDVDQCEEKEDSECHITSALKELHKTHKCHASTFCDFVSGHGWSRGSYICRCRPGFYAKKPLEPAFNGTLVEHEYGNYMDNTSSVYMDIFRCHRCEPGCAHCVDSSPCLANYNWPFRIALLTVSCICVAMTLVLIGYMAQHHRLKVFKVASPIFLSITLLGCAIMYLEMAAIFPVLDMYSCIATKWARHLGFCVTYTALLMKTWRVSLTYRVKSAHKVKLTDKQLLQWMFPILLVMLIYLGTWTLSAPPQGEDILDNAGLRFKQCTYNWWDHSLAIGEVLFLAWGIRVCYNVRHAESLYNEARLITYAIYNIAAVNIAMVAFHLMIFPRAGPDIKYLLGFIRTQLGTSTTVALVFGPKVYRVLRGQGDQYDSRARARGVTASFSLNGIGLVSEEPPDLYQENEELKEEIQKLAAQIEFMRIVHMEMNNRHLKPKPGGYFSGGSKSHLRPEPSDTDAPAL